MKLWIRNELPPVNLVGDEQIGPPIQDSFVDPLADSDFVHYGPTVQELLSKGYVGVYLDYPLRVTIDQSGSQHTEG